MNLENILIEKEEMKKQLVKINNTKFNKKNSLKFYKKSMLLTLLGGIICGITSSLAVSLIAQNFDIIYSLGITLIFTLTGGCMSWRTYKDYKEDKRAFYGAELQIYFLEKEIPLKEQELEKLKENSQKIEISNEQLDIVKVDDRETLIKLREYLNKLGEYGKRISKYANKPLSEADKETLRNDGIDSDLFEKYLMEYNVQKLTRSKMVSWF